jgi:hypothetical protein
MTIIKRQYKNDKIILMTILKNENKPNFKLPRQQIDKMQSWHNAQAPN